MCRRRGGRLNSALDSKPALPPLPPAQPRAGTITPPSCARGLPNYSRAMSSDEDEGGPKNMRFSAARDFDNLTEIGGEFYGISQKCSVRFNSFVLRCPHLCADYFQSPYQFLFLLFATPHPLECAGTQRQGRRQTKEQQLYGVFADDDEETDWNSKPPERPAFTCVFGIARHLLFSFLPVGLCIQSCFLQKVKWHLMSINFAVVSSVSLALCVRRMAAPLGFVKGGILGGTKPGANPPAATAKPASASSSSSSSSAASSKRSKHASGHRAASARSDDSDDDGGEMRAHEDAVIAQKYAQRERMRRGGSAADDEEDEEGVEEDETGEAEAMEEDASAGKSKQLPGLGGYSDGSDDEGSTSAGLGLGAARGGLGLGAAGAGRSSAGAFSAGSGIGFVSSSSSSTSSSSAAVKDDEDADAMRPRFGAGMFGAAKEAAAADQQQHMDADEVEDEHAGEGEGEGQAAADNAAARLRDRRDRRAAKQTRDRMMSSSSGARSSSTGHPSSSSSAEAAAATDAKKAPVVVPKARVDKDFAAWTKHESGGGAAWKMMLAMGLDPKNVRVLVCALCACMRLSLVEGLEVCFAVSLHPRILMFCFCSYDHVFVLRCTFTRSLGSARAARAL